MRLDEVEVIARPRHRHDGDNLVIKPVRQEYLNRVQESTVKVMRAHRATLKKLAD